MFRFSLKWSNFYWVKYCLSHHFHGLLFLVGVGISYFARQILLKNTSLAP